MAVKVFAYTAILWLQLRIAGKENQQVVFFEADYKCQRRNTKVYKKPYLQLEIIMAVGFFHLRRAENNPGDMKRTTSENM